MSNKKTVEHEVESLSDADLRSALTEAEQWREKGILEKGWIREVSSDRLAQVYPLPVASLQSMVSQEVYRQAALRWANQ